MRRSDDISKIAEALAKAQGEFQNPVKNRTVTVQPRDQSKRSYTFDYATLDNILDCVRPALSRNGIAISQPLEFDDQGRGAVLTCLMHSSGQWLETAIPMYVKDGADNANQAQGSAISYARRYGLTAMLGLASEEDDDGNGADGNSAQGKDRRPPQRPAATPPAQPPKPAAAPATAPAAAPLKSTATLAPQHQPAKPPAASPPSQEITDAAAKAATLPGKAECDKLFSKLGEHMPRPAALAIWSGKPLAIGDRHKRLLTASMAVDHICSIMGTPRGEEMILDLSKRAGIGQAGVKADVAEQAFYDALLKAQHGEVAGNDQSPV